VITLNNDPTYTEAYSREAVELMGLTLMFSEQTVTPYVPEVVIGNAGGLDLAVELGQNFPNPFVSETTINFNLPEAGEATISIYDMTGRVLRDITRDFAAGPNSVKLEGKDFGVGMMIYTLTFKEDRLSKTMIRSRQ
jgi:hypothetical protein